MEDNITFILQL